MMFNCVPTLTSFVSFNIAQNFQTLFVIGIKLINFVFVLTIIGFFEKRPALPKNAHVTYCDISRP